MHALKVLHRTQIRVKIERLSQSNIDTGSAGANRSLHGSLQRHPVLANGFKNACVHEVDAAALNFRARRNFFPLYFQSGSREYLFHGPRYFRSDTVSGNQSNGVFHVGYSF